MAAFIHMKNTPKGIALFASEEVSAPNVRKRFLAKTHPQSAQVERVMRVMHARIPSYGVRNRPTLAMLAHGIAGAVFIRGDGRNSSDRILVKVEG